MEQSISTSKRALFTLNALRLSIRDLQLVLSGPTIANVLFTSIQITRTLTQARRLTRALAAEQTSAGVAGLFGGGARGVGVARGIGALAGGQTTLTFGAAGALGAQAPSAAPGFFTSLLALAAANPLLTGVVIGTFAVGGIAIFTERERRIRREFRARNREVAKAQGLEP